MASLAAQRSNSKMYSCKSLKALIYPKMPVLSKFVDKGFIDFSGFINDLYYKPHFIDLEKMSFLLHFVLQATFSPKAQELQICSKQASIHEKMDHLLV